MNLSNMSAYGAQVNLKLLNSIISFVVSATNASYTQKENLHRLCIFPNQTASVSRFQEELGFLYLGELLERYEERFGMPLPDRRAIALALGYTRDIATPEMFIGSQRADFIQGVRRCAEGDIYLTGALYLIHGGESTAVVIEQRLKDWAYTQTEELIFAMSLFPDTGQALAQFGDRLVNLLGKGRTLPIFGNTDIFNCAFIMLHPLKKQMKAKRMAPLRALLSLPVSFVREGSKHHDWLLECGYTPIEIVYLNAAALCSQYIPGGPGRKSLTAEKLIVALFRTVLAHDQALPAEVYEQLSQIYQKYASFEIKCYGEHRLSDTLKGGLHIQTPETMAWFVRCSGEALHPATMGFDVMDSKWDVLAGNLEPDHYRRLFEGCLTEDMNAVQIQERLDRYRTLTQKDYLDCYNTETPGIRFSLLVKTGIIDLWTAFQGCLAEDGAVANSTLLQHIQDYCHEIKTIQAFTFYKQFLCRYGYQGLKRYFSRNQNGFEYVLWRKESYGNGLSLTLDRDFLTDDPDGQRLLLHWADEYFFTVDPNRYLTFAQSVLENEKLAGLLPPEDQRGLFDVVITLPKLSASDADKLKQRYFTPEEQRADQEAKEAAAAEQERQAHRKLIQEIEAYYAESNDGTFGFAIEYLNKYQYWDERKAIARRVLHDGLEPLLQGCGHTLTPKEADHFLNVCGDLISGGALDWAEFQSHISKIKEVVSNADGDPAQ